MDIVSIVRRGSAMQTLNCWIVFSMIRECSRWSAARLPLSLDMAFEMRQKQILVTLLLMLLLPAASFSQVVPPPQVEPIGPPLFVVKVKGKDGFIDRDGKIVIEPTFEKAYPFTDGLAAVEKQGRWGFIDTTGRVVIEPQFVMVGLFSDGLASFKKTRCSDPWGYIDKRGEWVILPRFKYANDFSEGLAGVSLREEGWGFIDRSGREVIPAKFSWVYGGFRHGVAKVTLDRKGGYINKKGECWGGKNCLGYIGAELRP
jgi:hypothetical protein